MFTTHISCSLKYVFREKHNTILATYTQSYTRMSVIPNGRDTCYS